MTAPLEDIAAGLAQARALWAAAVHHDPDRRFFARLLETDAYAAWVIGWAPGQGVGLHDHGGSAGAVVVVDGRLVESEVVPGAGVRHRTVGTGESFAFGAGHVHGVANFDDRPATSIHVYSPPLRAMTYFGSDDGDPAPTRIEPVTSSASHPELVRT